MTAVDEAMVVCVGDLTAEPRLDERFARCLAYAVFSAQGELLRVVENRARDAAGAASTLAATQLRELGAAAVVAAKFGPKAAGVLQAAGIRAYRCAEAVSAREAAQRAVRGELPFE